MRKSAIALLIDVATHEEKSTCFPSRAARFGFKVRGYAPISLADRLNAQARFVEHISNLAGALPDGEIAVELRYVVQPGRPEREIPDTVSLYLLARYTLWGASVQSMRKRAQALAIDLEDIAATTLAHLHLEALDRKELLSALKPFSVRDTVELRRPHDTDSRERARNLLGLLTADRMIHLLLRSRTPALLSICISPRDLGATALDGNECSTSPHPFTGQMPLPPALTSGEMRVSASLTPEDLQTLLAWEPGGSGQQYLMRVQLAAAGQLPASAISTLMSELTQPHRDALTMQPLAARTFTSRVVPVRPRSARTRGASRTEFKMAVENLHRLAFAPWGITSQAELPHLRMGQLGDAARLFGLPQSLPWLAQNGFAMHLPFTRAVREGIRLGISPAPSGARDVIMPFSTRAHHTWIIGQTGTGKTTLMTSMIYQDIIAGRSVIVIDPHGDMIEHLLQIIPENRMDDVILFDPRDRERTLGINPLDCQDDDQQTQIINAFLGLLIKLYDPHTQGIIGPRFEHNVRNVMYTVMSVPGMTLVEVLRALQDDRFVHRSLLPHVTDPLVKRYWTDQIAHTNSYHRSEILDWLVSKFSHFVSDKRMRRVLGQGSNTFSFREAMDSGKIVLLNLAKGVLGDENSQFFGLIALPMVLQAAVSRANVPEADRREVSVYVDEVQNYATDSIAQMLAEARKYRMALTLANQHAGQLSGEIFDALVGNAGTLLSFRLGTKDAPAMAQMLAPSQVSDVHLTALPNHHAYGHMLIDGQRTSVFLLQTEPVLAERDPQRAAEIRRRSRERYARANEETDKEILRRSGMEPEPPQDDVTPSGWQASFPALSDMSLRVVARRARASQTSASDNAASGANITSSGDSGNDAHDACDSASDDSADVDTDADTTEEGA